MFKPKVRHVRQSQVEKFTRYSIRKVSFGAASVAVATGLFFLGGGSVQAAEPVTNPESTEVQNLNGKSPDPSKEVAGQVSATAKVAEGQNNTSVKESATDKQASEVETPTVVTEKADINTASLEDLVAKVESRLSQLTEGKKTKSVIDDAKNLVHKAKELLNDDTKTQAKVDALAKQLSSSLVILNSIKSEVTEDKVNKNQDPRNGQVIPGNGESGFREATGTVADGTENPVAVNTNDITQKASELEAEIAKVEALISAENAKREGEKDKGFIEILTQVKESAQAVKIKGDNIPTTEKEKHALLQELKAKVDLLKLYQAKKLDWGAPANNHLANYGNNPTNAIISNLNNTFGTPDFSGSDSHEKVVKNQRNGLSGTILGSAKYHWKEKNISVSDASAGALDGWKIVDKPGKNIVTLVKPEQPTAIQRENGVTEREYNPNSAKVYDNNGKANMDGQGAPNASGKLLNTMITTPKFEAPEAGSGTVNKDFYLELRKQGTTIYKDFDVNPNSHLYAHLLYAGAYGKLALASTGEKVKLKIVDAYTGTPLAELKREDKKAPDTEFLLSPGSGNRGVSALRRVIQIPKGTTKVRVFIEAADQPNGSNLGGEVEDGYIVAGLGLTTGPALSLTTTVVSGRNKEAYGFTNDAIYKNEQAGILEVTLSNRGGLDVSRDTKYKVTVTVPQGVKLGSIQGKDLNEANGFAVFAPSYTTNFRYDKQTRELTFEINIPNRKIEPKTGKTDTVKIPFIVTPDFVGEATFKITGQNGFGGKDALGNAIYPYGFAPDANRYNLPENFRANSLETSDNPDYKYNRSIYIDSMTGNSSITVPVGTSLDKIKELSKSKAKEKIESEEYKRKLDETNATATLDDQGTSTGVVATDVAKENAGVIKVPVVHSRDGKNYKNTVDIEVNVVKSTTDKLVVFEGDKITNDQVKSSVTPATIDTKAGVVNNPNEADVFSTTGKAGEAGLKIPTTVTHDSNGTNINETVTVPVLVLPKATGEVQVHKGASVDKVKEVAKAKAQTLTKATDFTGKLPTGATVTVGDITEAVAETLTNEKGTNKGIVNVPANYIVEGKTYNTTIPVTINVLGSETKTVYTLEGTQPKPADVNEAITPDKGGNLTPVTEADINKDVPTDKVKVGATDLNVKATVKYPTGDETVDVPVKVLPKATPTGVTVLKDTDENALTDAVKAKATEAVSKLTNLPDGITASLDERETSYTLPKTDSNGDKDTVPVKVLYKDDKGNVVGEDTINVPVKVVSSTPKPVVVFEGDKVTKDDVKGAVTTEGTKGEPAIADDITAKPGVKEVTVPVTYTDQNGETLTEPVKVKVTVLPKPTPKGIFVAKDSDKEKAKEKALAKAKEAIADGTFKGKLPANVTNVSIDENVENPDLSDDTDVTVTVKYTVDREEKTTVVKVPVTVVEGVPQIVPVDENNKQPNPENSIDKTEYPDDSTFEYDPKTPVNTTTPGDYTVNVIVKDKEGNPIAEVPATVRVVESYPQFVPVDKDKKQPAVEGSIDPKAFPKDTEFTYETPVDTTRPGEKDVVVVAKIGDEVIAKVPAKVMVVEPKTQYVPVDKSKKQPDASKSIDPEQYPDGVTFNYKNPVDTTTPGEKDVIVEAKDGDDTLVEVPTKVKVVQGYPQIVPVDENNKQPNPENSIDKTEYPDGSTFEYDPNTPVDTTTPGDYTVNVIVKDKEGNPIAEVPATVRVVESYPQFVPVDKDKKQPSVEGSIDPKAFPKDTEFTYESPVDTTTPGEKDVVVVAKIGDKVITKVPAKVMVVEPKTQYVPVDKSNKQPDASKSIDPEQYPDGVTFNYKTPVDTTTPGEKDVIVEAKDGEDKLVEVPAKIKVVQGKEQLTPVNAEDKDKPKAEDSITPSDYPEGSTFEYKVPEGQTTPYDGTTPGDKPVTVVVKDKDGKVLVEVPATIKVVETKPTPIETPVTNTPLTEDDYTKGMKIPEGATVKVGDLPDLTTPGEKTPVKVTITLPNGKSYTVDVPVTVTPVKEIETPVTTTPLTPDDYTKGIKIPEGGKVTNVENIPDLTTPGKKDPVKVTIELPNGKVITVDVPVNVTPVKEIETPVTTTPLTPDDYTKGITIPEGGKVTKVENIPDLTTPGKKDPVKVTIELPNGKVITVDVPVNVTPVKEIETPVTTTPLTPDDYTKGITIPEGGKVTKVENIPDLTTPGKKDPVKVTVELPNGKVITVDVPVNVTPVKEIETPVTTGKLTPEDILKQIKVPEGATTKVENIPDLTTPGKKDPVKVTVTLPNGKVVTVDVPVTVTPVKEIETPVTTTPLTPDDYTKGITIPEGGKVTKVENIPDLTTPGKKDPVKVTVELPNGKVITVDVPVNVTPVKEIETPVTTGKLTPEDILKQIKVPEGATVKVGDLPDLTTPGKKDPVKVTITLPNGKVVTVEIPVTVTPIEDIVKKQGDPITTEDVEKHIPKGTKVISIGDKPSTDISGERPSIPVVIELPNGIRVTVNVPVIVTPKVTPVVVKVGTPVTPEDVQKHIELPNGWKVTKVGEIPTTTTPGTKPVVPVEIELPDGRKITVDVPVIVTPTVRQIVVPQGTPITPDDVKGHIDLPKEPGWEIVEVGEIPTTIPAGVKPSVKVKIKVPTGEIVEVEVPIIVTPKVTPIVVEVGTPITKEDVIKKVGLPEGWEIVEVGEIPTTSTPGKKDPVKVTIELPNGKVITVDVPVNVTPVKEIETPVTTTPLTPDDYTKGITIPEGGKVTKVENIPDLTTPGKKDPVKVTIELPNGKVITVDVPVNVTPVKEIETPVTTTPLTPDDYTKGITIPEGGKVTKVENIPDLTTPGKKDPVKVTVELPNGKVITVDVPVNVTPVKEIETPVTTGKLTPEDILKQIKVPEGATTKVENIPDLTTPGKKDPVKVTVTLPNGKVVTVDVPVTVTPVKEIETPVTTTPLTPDDYTKGITIPEGGKVTKVENIPDLTTPGKKDPVKVTVELPNGKVITVDVPVNVTPVKEIETPVTTGKLTPEDILKQIKVPEGATVKVGDLPDLTTPGKKDPVKVTITLPNGKVVTVEIPVTVTPIEDIVKKQGDPITTEDVEKHIPKGTKVISIGDKPSTDISGERPSIPVVIELPNGIRVTVNVPVIVTPKVTPVVVKVGTPVTPEDVQKHIELPNGWKVTKVGEIPTTTTPGTKPVVPVEIELPDGRKITVDVPVIVTPTVRQIVVPQGTPITPDDVKGHIDLPKEPGWEIVEVGEIPTTIPAGVKPSVKVKIKVPTGEIVEVEVPIIVTPKVTPIVVEVGTPITKEDVIKKVGLPEGWEIVEVGEIPTTSTPGKKDPVKVTIELPNGKVITVDVPVNVTPVKEIETPVTTTPLTPDDYTKGITIPEGGKVTKVENIPDLTTPGKKDPVKVTIELPNGKVITVDVPVNVTPVKEIETPVTTTPLTPDDYTKGITIPEGGKVTKVENIPDLTTPGKKDPVKVTVELPNGKVITVDVPVNVTPVKEIETPVTTGKLTPEDILKQIKVPEGATTKVENIPDLTTPGKKDPVKVTVTLPNGKVVTVDVPVTVTPVKEIETPVTTTPLTPDDYTKGITIPEGGKVTKVENIPDLTTPGKKDPVKVTVELPNGKVITVDVPVNVTPVKEIETPVTTGKLTPEDILKQIKVPEGATVKVGDLPDLTTPGKKDPVKVTITLPNGKVVTVEIPVTVTPIEDIVKKQGDPITTEDVEKHIPKGTKVISIGDKPSTDISGERPSIPVVIELPNGIRVTVNVPVIVTPKVTPVVVKVGTPVTPEDVQKHIELPNGWKVTKVGEIPTTTTPGTKPVVPVEIELPDGRKITVDVPVIVTPTVRQIVVPQGTPITPDDVKGHIDLPKEPGWEIVEVGEIPTTIPAGVKPSVKVKIKVPTGEIVEVEVPIIVTPKVTPIVVEVGTPITKEDVIKKVGLPEGWEIVEVGEIPTTSTPGTKPVVKVKVKLPDGRIITVEVPVTVTPKSQNGGGVISQNGDSTVQIVTEYLDENGNRITSDKEGKHNPIELEGYEFSHSTTDAKGNTLHHYKKVTNPINQEQPSAPETPTSPEKPVATPVQTSSTDSQQVSETTVSNDKKELPNTGTEDKAGLASLGLLGMLGAFGLVARKKKED